jgi:hypothetical protein
VSANDAAARAKNALREAQGFADEASRQLLRAEREQSEASTTLARIRERIAERQTRLQRIDEELADGDAERVRLQEQLVSERTALGDVEAAQESARERRVHWQVEEAQVSAREDAAREREARARELEADRVDVTLPGRPVELGRLHLSTQTLRPSSDIFAEMGFQVHIVPPVVVGGEVVRSTRVREALRSGDVARAARHLGRPFAVPGKVVRGSGRGKALGVPTANLSVWEQRATPAAGVYACVAEVGDRRWNAVTNIGVRPTFGDGQQAPMVEAHLLDFDGDLYGRDLRLLFVDRLRDERRFADPDALVAQVTRDIQRAREILDARWRDGSGL